MGIPEQNPMMSEAKIRASGSSVGKNSTVQSQPRALKFISANSYFAAGEAAVTFVSVVSIPDVQVLPPSVDDSNFKVYCVLETSFSVTRVFMDLPSIIISLVHVQVSPLTVPFAVITSPQLSNAL
jgi:hypothetical protein